MRYRVSTLLLVMTVTAIAVAGRPWLVGRHDLGVGVVLFSLWAATGFIFGWSASKWPTQRIKLITVAIAGCLANLAFWYTWHIAVSFLDSADSVIYSRTSLLAWLLELDEFHVFSGLAICSSLLIVIAAWTKREQLLAIGVAISLLIWFACFWAAFIWIAASTVVLD